MFSVATQEESCQAQLGDLNMTKEHRGEIALASTPSFSRSSFKPGFLLEIQERLICIYVRNHVDLVDLYLCKKP